LKKSVQALLLQQKQRLGVPVELEQYRPFKVEQVLFQGHTAAVPGQGAMLSDDTMAGDQDRQRIGPIGQPNRPAEGFLPQGFSNLAVSTGCAVGNCSDKRPDPELKRRSPQRQRNGKGAARAGKVLSELVNDLPTTGRDIALFVHAAQGDWRKILLERSYFGPV